MKYIIILLIFIITISGCTNVNENSNKSKNECIIPSNFDLLSDKAQVEIIHIKNLQYLIDGNGNNLAAAYSDKYKDLGGGPSGDGNVDMKSFFTSEGFNKKTDKLRNKKIYELIDVNQKRVFSYDEIMSSQYKDFGKKTGFEYKPGDILIGFPPKEGSLLFDGFFGVYRKENNEWKVIASD